jgi:Leucine-rich repeat (LRR) protein
MFNFDRTEYGKSLVCKSRNPNILNFLLKTTGSTCLDIRPTGEHWKDLRFLRKVIPLQALQLGGGMTLESFEGIEHQSLLKQISLEASSKCNFDWGVFGLLESVHTLNNFINSSFWLLSNLRKLGIENYGELNFDQINNLSKLRKLVLIQTKFDRLESLELPNIRFLEIRGANKLINLSGSRSATKIEELRLIGCPNLGQIDGLQEFINLKRLLLLDCGKIESLIPLINLDLIESVNVCGTRIEDGRLRFLHEKPSVVTLEFIDRKNYDLKYDEVCRKS